MESGEQHEQNGSTSLDPENRKIIDPINLPPPPPPLLPTNNASFKLKVKTSKAAAIPPPLVGFSKSSLGTPNPSVIPPPPVKPPKPEERENPSQKEKISNTVMKKPENIQPPTPPPLPGSTNQQENINVNIRQRFKTPPSNIPSPLTPRTLAGMSLPQLTGLDDYIPPLSPNSAATLIPGSNIPLSQRQNRRSVPIQPKEKMHEIVKVMSHPRVAFEEESEISTSPRSPGGNIRFSLPSNDKSPRLKKSMDDNIAISSRCASETLYLDLTVTKNEPADKPTLKQTLSSPDLKSKIPPVPPPRDFRPKLSDIDTSDKPEIGIPRSDTYSNINWEDLETEIMDGPATPRTMERRNTAYSPEQILESYRMRQFAVTAPQQRYIDLTPRQGNYESLFDELVADHRNAVNDSPTSASGNKRKSKILEKLNMSDKASSESQKRKRANSTVGLNKILKQQQLDKSISLDNSKDFEKKKKEEKKKKKKLKKKSKEGLDNSTMNASPNIDIHAEAGKRALEAIRGKTTSISLTELIARVQRHSTLPITSNNQNIDKLYFYEFEEDDDETIEFDEVSEDPNNNITYATMFKMIQRLSHPTISSDALLLSVFLLTYRSFVSPRELLELLICRSFAVPTNPSERTEWESKLPAIRNRILIITCQWVEKYFHCDFVDNEENLFLLAHYVGFIAEDPKSKLFVDLIHRGVGHHTIPSDSDIDITQGKKNKIPKPYNPKVSGPLKLRNLHPTEVARQMAIVEKSMFDKITPGEYAHQGWTRDDKLTRSPNIVALINRFNSICNWASSVVLKTENLKERAVILHRLIIIAEESRALRNYNAVMAIISGLQCSAIYRLSQTWNLLPSKTWDIWDGLNELMSNENNFATYRKELKESPKPCVPYIGIFLTDLVFVEDGNQDFKEGTLLMNVKKLRFAASIMFSLEKCRGGTYHLTPLPQIQSYLSDYEPLSEEEQKEYSLALQGLGT